ncbi:MAG: hypothetical protein ACJAVT_000431 [Yoonia sp.]|jgi:hypothetical protein
MELRFVQSDSTFSYFQGTKSYLIKHGRPVAFHSDQRYIIKDLKLKYDRKCIMLKVNDLTRGFVGKYVYVFEIANVRIQVRAKGIALPHVILNPERRIMHASMTHNNWPGAVLAYIEEEQNKAAPPPNVKPVSAKNGYKKSSCRSPGRPARMEACYERWGA